jgi:hypothetical protein
MVERHANRVATTALLVACQLGGEMNAAFIDEQIDEGMVARKDQDTGRAQHPLKLLEGCQPVLDVSNIHISILHRRESTRFCKHQILGLGEIFAYLLPFISAKPVKICG